MRSVSSFCFVAAIHDHPDEETRLYRTLDKTPFEFQSAMSGLSAEEALSLLHINSYYELQGNSIPADLKIALDHFITEKLILKSYDGTYTVTNLGALLFAKDIGMFTFLGRKSPRVIKYKGKNKIEAEREQSGVYGYATGFEGLINYIGNLLPSNEHIESALRTKVSKYPLVIIRELVANALIHQDFSFSGAGPMIEIYEDRIEITNPGKPLIKPERFVDAPPVSRNEKLAAVMRRSHICEERGSGWDRIAEQIELNQLPAPTIRVAEGQTVVTLNSPKPLSEMDEAEKIQAVYLHACLQAVSNLETSNRSVRQRFGLTDRESAKASAIIKLALEAGKIVVKDPHAGRKNMKYLPAWASASEELDW